MSARVDCGACQVGNHADHDPAHLGLPGVIGGQVCGCAGDCAERHADDFTRWLDPLRTPPDSRTPLTPGASSLQDPKIGKGDENRGDAKPTETAVITAGVYQHYKGPRYLVMGLAHDSNHDGRVAVIYVPLYDAPGPRLAVRDLADFRSWVHKNGSRCDAETCEVTATMRRREAGMRLYNETHQPRFRLVNEAGTPG